MRRMNSSVQFLAMRTFHKSRLPHILPIGATFFVTYRLADALPQPIIKKLEEELADEIKAIKKAAKKDIKEQIINAKKRYFGKFDKQLDREPFGACHLKIPEIANLVKESLFEKDEEWYELLAFCIMPNHVHILLDTSRQLCNEDGEVRTEIELEEKYVQLDKIMKQIKGSSARYINMALNRNGTLWQKDSYDHYVRNEKEWKNILNYILENPVKAGLVNSWEDWPFSYYKYQEQ